MTNYVPAEAPGLLTWEDLQPIVNFSRTTLHRELHAGRFPKPLKISAMRRAWLKSDIERWFEEKVAARAETA